MVRIWEETRKTVIFVSHSFMKAINLAHRIIVVAARLGRIKGVIKVDLPRPEGFTKEQYLRTRKKVFDLLKE